MRQKIIAVFFILSVLCLKAAAQDFWTRTDETSLLANNSIFTHNYRPANFISFRLDEVSFKNQLITAPSEKNITAGKSSFIVVIPNSAGKKERFEIAETFMMQPGLAAKYSTIKTYAGKGIDEPTSTIVFDVTPQGFHGMILSAVRKTIYINPVDRKNNTYIVFDRDGLAAPNKIFDCKTEQLISSEIQAGAAKSTNDGNLRTFRFAVTTGAEFSTLLLDGTEQTDAEKRTKVLAGLVTDLARINGITQTDLGVRLTLVNKEDELFFFDAATDPFLSNPSGVYSVWGTECQHTIDSIIAPQNYDIGHLLMALLTSGNSGCIGCVCVNTAKGSAATGFDGATGDPFVVDVWAHEIGHQLGANHTFTYRFEGTGAQMEPGSGSTIMSYAGALPGNLNVQPHSDAYYHAISIQQITDNLQTGSGAACAVVTNTGNHVPVVSTGTSYTIPKNTPFKLTGQASDADEEDLLTYCWEQFDEYLQGTSNTQPDALSTSGPVFRSVSASTSPSRTFPALPSILDGSNKNTWEVLPRVRRQLNFRLTVRDNQPFHGSTASTDVFVNIDSLGPFSVATPNTNVKWQQSSVQTVKWNVANTNNAPVNCANVGVLLSADGGQTFPYILSASSPNNGSASVTMPAVVSKHCRIMIQAVNNIFFDISDSDFTITAVMPVTLISFTAQLQKQDVLLHWVTENEINNSYFLVERSIDNLNYTSIGKITAADNTAATQNAYSFIDNNAYTGTVYYRLKQVDKDGAFTYSHVAVVNIALSNVLWQVYPNPAGSKTSVHIKAAINRAQLQLSNADGRVVYTNTFYNLTAGQVIGLPLQNLAKGAYLLTIKTATTSKTEKIVVE